MRPPSLTRAGGNGVAARAPASAAAAFAWPRRQQALAAAAAAAGATPRLQQQHQQQQQQHQQQQPRRLRVLAAAAAAAAARPPQVCRSTRVKSNSSKSSSSQPAAASAAAAAGAAAAAAAASAAAASAATATATKSPAPSPPPVSLDDDDDDYDGEQSTGLTAAADNGDSDDGGDPLAAPSWIPAVGLSALAAFVCSVDRAALSVAILPMAEAFGWPDSTKGLVAASFYVGYTVFNLVGGVLATQGRAKRVLGVGVVVWSAFTIATPAAAASPALPVLLATRALMGAGEGVTYPSVQALVRGWVPPDGRSRALTLTYAAAQLGTVVALLTAPVIISAYGWEAVFFVYGSLGFVWSALWWPLVADVPPALEEERRREREEQEEDGRQWQREHDERRVGQRQLGGGRGRPAPPSPSPAPSPLATLVALPWGEFLASRPFWAILIAHAAFGVGHYVTLTWLPSFYAQRYDLDVASASLLSVFPWVMGVAVSSLSGAAADALANRGLARTGTARRLMQGVGALGPAACLAWLAAADAGAERAGEAAAGVPVDQAAVALTLAIALAGFQSAGFASNHQDIAAKYAPVLFGITNATSSLLGTASVYGVGAVLDAYGDRPESGWAAIWAGVAACYVVGAAFFLSWSSSDRQFD